MFFDAVEVQLSNSCGMPWTPEDVGEPVENLDEGVAISRRASSSKGPRRSKGAATTNSSLHGKRQSLAG
jgi:hypothetical protein